MRAYVMEVMGRNACDTSPTFHSSSDSVKVMDGSSKCSGKARHQLLRQKKCSILMEVFVIAELQRVSMIHVLLFSIYTTVFFMLQTYIPIQRERCKAAGQQRVVRDNWCRKDNTRSEVKGMNYLLQSETCSVVKIFNPYSDI